MKLSSNRRSARFRHGVVAAALFGAAAGASAEERGWYVGMMLDDCTRVEVDRGWYSLETGPTTSGYTLRGGLRLNKHLAVDFALERDSNLEWTEQFATVPDVPGPYDSHVVFDSNIVQASVVGIVPFGKVFEGYGRVGLEHYRLGGEQLLTDWMGGPSLSRPVSSNGSGLVIGLGVGATFAKTWHVSFEVETLTIGEAFLGIGSRSQAWVSTVGFGIERRFGRGRSGDDAVR